jgi:hypothetical protein
MKPSLWLRRVLRNSGHAFSITMHERLDAIEQRSSETDNALLQASIRMAERIRETTPFTVATTCDPKLSDPVVALAVYLYSHLASRRVVDADKARGNLSEVLQSAGYEVSKLEPGCALPERVALMRLAERDLETLGTSGAEQPEVVIIQDPEKLEHTVTAMRERGFHWHLVIYRDGPDDPGRYFASYITRVPWNEAKLVFFRDRHVFAEAQAWCSAVLRRTYFRYARA